MRDDTKERQVTTKRGLDKRDVDRLLAELEVEALALGIVLDTGSRKVTKGGNS